MKEHIHHRSTSCCCYQLADEPNEDCPVHGYGEWPAKCAECGRFIPWPQASGEISCVR